MLVAEGLDTVATVTINGVLVLSADDMFRTWRVDVAGVLNDVRKQLLVMRMAAPLLSFVGECLHTRPTTQSWCSSPLLCGGQSSST
jgi:hypothetical protein